MKKKVPSKSEALHVNEMKAEYNFSGGERGRYAKRMREEGYTIRVYEEDGSYTEQRILGEKTVILEPDVWEYFPNSQTVNQALRALIALTPEKRKGVSKKALPKTARLVTKS